MYTTDSIPPTLQKPNTRWDFITIFATLNFILIMCGYQFSSSLLSFMGFGANSQLVTVPYRAFSFGVAFLCVFLGMTLNVKRYANAWIYLLSIFPILWLLRMFVDLNFDCPELMYIDTSKVWGYGLYTPICLLGVFLTYDRIDFDKSLLIILSCFVYVMALIPLGLTQADMDVLIDSSNSRVGVSPALYAISSASMGMAAVMMSICVIFSRNRALFWKLVSILAIGLGIYAIFRSGTRSIFLVLMSGMIFWIGTLYRNFLLNMILIGLFSILLYVFRMPLVEFIAKFAPILGNRLRDTFESGDSSGRIELFRVGMEKMLNSPLFGERTIDLARGMLPSTVAHHSSVIDGFAFFGAIVGSLMLFVSLYLMWASTLIMRFRKYIYNYWVAAVLFPKMVNAMLFSGLFFNLSDIAVLAMIVMIIVARFEKTHLNRMTVI